MTGSGIHVMTADAYHADPCERPSLSASIAAVLCDRSPMHAWTLHPKLNPAFVREDESKFDIGTVAHAVFLEGSDSRVVVVDAPDWRKKDAQEQRDQARVAGKIPLLADQWVRVQAMAEALSYQVDAFPVDPPLFTNGDAEQTLVWDEGGVTCRARLDWLRRDHTVIDDLKTTYSAEPHKWSRTLFNIGADIQAAFYLRGLHRLTGKSAAFRFVVVETQPPHAISVNSITPAALALADRKVQHAIDTWRRCLDTGTWPAYPMQVCWAEPAPWAEQQWLDREALDEEVAA